ncbi:methionine--tRNA ligase, partial [Rubrimonas sp.]|uniref:methionine--tRNA ligase n=1 Tax=Rubrimonas sp. TaxID=2036015 RepID=UPI002FDD225A
NDGEGLQDRGITRDLDWGIPVKRGTEDWPGMEGKVFYVWFDAPIEYIGATAEWADAGGLDDEGWLRWWREDHGAADVRYVEFMAKDNIPFHTLSFPATLMGANFDGAEPWKLVDYIKGFNWLTYEGGKFSTSQGRGVFMDQALESFPSDCWRWWLLANAPETSDSDFTWAAFQSGVNKDLADVLGNFVSRVTKFCRSKFGETVPAGGDYGPEEQALAAELQSRLDAHAAAMEAMELRRAAAELRAAWVAGNEYLQRAAPWAAHKTDPDRSAAITRCGLNLVRLYGIVSRPFIPDAADAMLRALGLDPQSEGAWPASAAQALDALPAGHGFTVPDNLFAKIEDDARAALEARFAGGAG